VTGEQVGSALAWTAFGALTGVVIYKIATLPPPRRKRRVLGPSSMSGPARRRRRGH
jgi:hypothetical protein